MPAEKREATLREVVAVTERREVPKDEVAVKAVGVLEVRRHRQLREGTQGDAMYRQMLPFVPSLHCARDVVVGVLTGHPAAVSEALEKLLD